MRKFKLDRSSHISLNLEVYILFFGGDLASTGTRKLKAAYRGLRVHAKEAVNNQVLKTTTHWQLNIV